MFTPNTQYLKTLSNFEIEVNMSERAHCSICDRTFSNQEALDMHNKAKHSASQETSQKKSSSRVSIPTRKKIALFGYFLGTALIVWGVVGFLSGDETLITGAAVALGVDEPFLGDENAPVTIIEFGDFQCPICQRHWATTLPQLKSQYIDTGKVKYVFVDFPLRQPHPMAQKSAEAANCVLEQAFFDYHDVLYGNQNQLSKDNLKLWALDQGYDISECLDSKRFKSEVDQDFRQGTQAGVRGTPTFLINGQILTEAQPFPVFQQLIEAELAKVEE